MELIDKTKQFVVEKDAEVRFKLRRGCTVSRQARLLVNKPLVDQQTGQISYTVTQPLIPADYDLEIAAQNGGIRLIDYKESSPVENQYLERVEPYQFDSSINIEFRVKFPQSGSFFIQIEYEDSIIGLINYTQPVVINVEPIMILQDQLIKCKQLSIITVLSRCLGPLSRWESVLNNVSQLGYNAVHFTPIQQYGSSYSHYSLADQTIIDDYYFSDVKDHSSLTKEERLKSLKQAVNHFREEYGLLGIIDIVLNHTASNSPWLLDHPEAAYNTDDCPHLYPAWLLDKALSDFSDDFSQRKNVPECPSAPYINNEQDLRSVLNAIQNRVINRLNLHEFFMFNIDKVIEEEAFILNLGYGPDRYSVTLDLPKAIPYFYLANNQNQDKVFNELRILMQKHNSEYAAKVKEFMQEALKCIEGTNERQSKVAHNGWIMNADPMEDFGMKGWHYLRRTINIWSDSVKLRYGMSPEDSPFIWNHMSQYVADMATVFDGFRLDNAHSTPIHVCYYLLQVARTHNPNLYVMAELFTSSSLADAIFVQKLNINGLVREIQNTYDARNLGDYFHQLTCREQVLGLIDPEFEDLNGISYRVLKPIKPNEIIYDCTHDNPAPVEKFRTPRIALPHMGLISMADTAIATTWGYDQIIPKNLNVVTEKRLYEVPNQENLFRIDGIDSSNYRKKKNSSHKTEIISPEWTPEDQIYQEESKEFSNEFVYYNERASKVELAGCFTQWKPIYELKKQTHNKWSLTLTLPIINAQAQYEYKFVVNGKDWCINPDYPQIKDRSGNINNALYMPNSKPTSQQPSQPSFQPQSLQEHLFPDLRYARRLLNEIHQECTQNNAEIFLHQQSNDVIVLVRQFNLDHASNYDSYVSITRFPYYQEGGDYWYQTRVELPGYLTEVVFAGYVEIPQNLWQQFYSDNQQIKGAQAQFRVFKDLSKFCKVERQQEKDILNFYMMPPSFTCVVKTRYPEYMKDAVKSLNHMANIRTEILSKQLFSDVPLSAINHLLFRGELEERDISGGKRGAYGLQKYGVFVYSGITSIIHLIRQIKVSGDMGHELFDNIRQGNWLLDYSIERLQSFMPQELNQVIHFYQNFAANVKALNCTLKPRYASKVIEKLYNSAIHNILQDRMHDPFIRQTSSDDLFLQRLATSTVQMWGRIPSAQFRNFQDTMAAGLPHFTTGYMRCWGRDTFISLRGLLIAPGLEQEAKETIMYFASTMRHGLIPNLHDRCNNTRFNARDATWFFIQVFINNLIYNVQGIKDFVKLSRDNGLAILQETVELHFRDNDQRIHWEKINRGEPPRRLSLAELIHEMIQAHASGINFREWNAGTQIDAHMKSEGFNMNINLDTETGFIFGGNQYNCGTWMDKMGSSEKTGNRGIPATPRDGAPIELVALLYTALRFMQELSDQGEIKTHGVRIKNGEEWSYKLWADKIEENFEKYYWIPVNQNEDKDHVIDKRHVKRRGIYKDVLRSSQQHTDYQLRPNLCVAMAYAPELFDKEHAKICLDNVEKILIEPNCMGMKTLDPSDPNYKGDYINSDDSQGWNYHQGPEWLWPLGFFLKSKIIFNEYSSLDKSQALEQEPINVKQLYSDIMRFLLPHQKHIMTDVWEGLPELTNSHGKQCKDSCTTQAWSIATILDALRDLYYL